MLTPTRSFTLTFLAILALLGLGCPADMFGTGYPTELDNPVDDDTTPVSDDDDSTSNLPDGPADDDDSTSADNEPPGAPCFGREPSENDFDCDGVPDVGLNPEDDDLFFTDPVNPRVIYRASVLPDGSVEYHQVGYGYGDAIVHNGWLYENGQAVLRVDNFVIVEVAPGIYRVNLVSQNGNWGDVNDFCEYGVHVATNLVAYDQACVYDAGCATANPPIPPGWALAYKATTIYTRVLTEGEIDNLPLAEDDCPTAQ